MAPELVDLGLVTDALWTDFDQDGRLNLIVVGEWMPVTFFRNEAGRADQRNRNHSVTDSTTGWWNTLVADDFDQDGDPDYIVGNLGLNSKYKASADRTGLSVHERLR